MSAADPVAIGGPAELRAWRAAVNARDADGAVRLSAADIRLGGPRGAATGHDTLRRWVAEAGIRLDPLGWHEVEPGIGVAEEEATWPHRVGAEPEAPPIRVFTACSLRDGLVAAVLRHDTREAALAAAEGLRREG